MNGLRILWLSNAPHVGSGYGVQSNSLLPRLLKHPNVEEIGIFGYFGIQGGLVELEVGKGIPGVKPVKMAHYPIGLDMWGNDVIWEHAKHFDADVVITLLDAWVFRDDYGHGGFLWCPYAPVDHDPIPPPVVNKLRRGFHSLAYSKHGAAAMAAEGLDSQYMPLGVETSIFKPYTTRRKKEAKKWVGVESDNFVVGTVAANNGWPSRKGYPELFEAFSLFHKTHPDARLIAHTCATGNGGGNGLDLFQMAKQYGIENVAHFTTPYQQLVGFSTKEMCRFYNAFDVFCLPSMGEGFGIPLIEAQASGVPVITTDWTACAELGSHGWLVPIAKKIPTPLQSFQGYADVPALVHAMEEAYMMWKTQPAAWEAKRQDAREFAMQYDWEYLVETNWFPFMDWLWERVRVKTLQRTPSPLVGVPTNGASEPNTTLAREQVGVQV